MKTIAKVFLTGLFFVSTHAQARSTQTLSVTYGFLDLKPTSSVVETVSATKALREALLKMGCMINLQQFFLQNSSDGKKFLAVQGSLSCVFNASSLPSKVDLGQKLKEVQAQAQEVHVTIDPIEREWRPGITVSN